MEGKALARLIISLSPSRPWGSATSFRVWLLEDSGTGSIAQQRVRDAMLAETGGTPPNLIRHARDIAYQDGTDAEFTNNHSPSPQGVENGY